MNWSDIKNQKPPSGVRYGTIAGVSFVPDYPQNLLMLHAQMQAPLPCRLRRNPDNQYDANAVEVYYDGAFLGHLSKELAAEVAPKLDQGTKFDMLITSIGFANNDPSKPGAAFRIEEL